MLHLLVEEPYEALGAVGQLIRLCEPPGDPSAAAEDVASPGRLSAAGRALLRTRDALKRIECIREKLPGFDWCRRAVLLGLAAAVKDGQAADALRELASWGRGRAASFSRTKGSSSCPGVARAEVQSAIDAFKPVLLRACEGLSFTLFGGGTTAGISGLAGDVAQQSGGRVRAFGYLPRLLPRGVQEDLNPERFARRFNSSGSDFTPLGAAARLDRYCGRRRGPPAREAPQLCRRTDLADRVHPWPLRWGRGWAWSKTRPCRTIASSTSPTGKSAPTSFSSPWTP